MMFQYDRFDVLDHRNDAPYGQVDVLEHQKSQKTKVSKFGTVIYKLGGYLQLS